MIKAVIFDLDDTLYPEAEFVRSGFERVAHYLSEKHNVSFFTVCQILKNDFKAGLRHRNFNVLLDKIDLGLQPAQELVAVYDKHFPTLSLYPDAKTALKWLRNRYQLGIITDGNMTRQENKIAALDIRNYFSVIIINDRLSKTSKSKTRPFIEAIDRLHAAAYEAVFVGDNPLKDFKAAKQLGIHTARIIRADGFYGDVAADDESNAEYTITNLNELAHVIDTCDHFSLEGK
jgi:putative hydrolase of the HAD superfamily